MPPEAAPANALDPIPDGESSNEELPEFFEPEDIIQLGNSAMAGIKNVAGAFGGAVSTVKDKLAEHKVGKRVANVSWNALHRGWNTLTEAAEFWVNDGLTEEDVEELYKEEDARNAEEFGNQSRLPRDSAASRRPRIANPEFPHTLHPNDPKELDLTTLSQVNTDQLDFCSFSSSPAPIVPFVTTRIGLSSDGCGRIFGRQRRRYDGSQYTGNKDRGFACYCISGC